MEYIYIHSLPDSTNSTLQPPAPSDRYSHLDGAFKPTPASSLFHRDFAEGLLARDWAIKLTTSESTRHLHDPRPVILQLFQERVRVEICDCLK